MCWLKVAVLVTGVLLVNADGKALRRKKRTIIPPGIWNERNAEIKANGSPEFRFFKKYYGNENFEEDMKSQLTTHAEKEAFSGVNVKDLKNFRPDFQKYDNRLNDVEPKTRYEEFVKDTFKKIKSDKNLNSEDIKDLMKKAEKCAERRVDQFNKLDKYNKFESEKSKEIHRRYKELWKKESKNLKIERKRYVKDLEIKERAAAEERTRKEFADAEEAAAKIAKQEADAAKIAKDAAEKAKQEADAAEKAKQEADAAAKAKQEAAEKAKQEADAAEKAREAQLKAETEQVEQRMVEEGWGDWFARHLSNIHTWLRKVFMRESVDDVENELQNEASRDAAKGKEEEEAEERKAAEKKEEEAEERKAAEKKAEEAAKEEEEEAAESEAEEAEAWELFI